MMRMLSTLQVSKCLAREPFFYKGNRTLEKRLVKCISVWGDYVEKRQNNMCTFCCQLCQVIRTSDQKTLTLEKVDRIRMTRCGDMPFDYFRRWRGRSPSWIWSNRKLRHSTRRHRTPYQKPNIQLIWWPVAETFEIFQDGGRPPFWLSSRK